ncbi:hypothetical protein OB925_02300 [Aeromonas rivipollensis]|uniref:hypothetical protein n=1 Tax=Aeromonas rivipollensis TaxID=948519 RepID=UPI00259DBA88|nr:hypothetical protein [Aeromonas rivipollensis]MDM5083694.1 hypothetical protein [Aeromonas rivipollensis]MDM5096072.1 hypothetical protein [Aeromonas rivipollensis]MDM5104375.1 hypothetical protein [Aeromonas rivipollensis]
MVETQELHFFTDKNEKVVTRIEKESGSFIGYISPTGNQTIIAQTLTDYGPSVGSFPTAIEAFQEIVRLICLYAQQKGEQIKTIGNPCNSPFLSLDDQKNNVSANITVK